MPAPKAYVKVSRTIRIARWIMRVGDWFQARALAFAWRHGTQTEALTFMNAYLRPFGRELVAVEDLMSYPRSALHTPTPGIKN